MSKYSVERCLMENWVGGLGVRIYNFMLLLLKGVKGRPEILGLKAALWNPR